VEEFEVATGGGIWVAAGGQIDFSISLRAKLVEECACV
jgi:hypothetical protein